MAVAICVQRKVRLIVYTNITQSQNGNRGGFETEIQLCVSIIFRVALLSSFPRLSHDMCTDTLIYEFLTLEQVIKDEVSVKPSKQVT